MIKQRGDQGEERAGNGECVENGGDFSLGQPVGQESVVDVMLIGAEDAVFSSYPKFVQNGPKAPPPNCKHNIDEGNSGDDQRQEQTGSGESFAG